MLQIIFTLIDRVNTFQCDFLIFCLLRFCMQYQIFLFSDQTHSILLCYLQASTYIKGFHFNDTCFNIMCLSLTNQKTFNNACIQSLHQKYTKSCLLLLEHSMKDIFSAILSIMVFPWDNNKMPFQGFLRTKKRNVTYQVVKSNCKIQRRLCAKFEMTNFQMIWKKSS